MQPAVIRQLLNRPADSHKYNYGHLLVIGGSLGMVGAPLLSGMAALRVGAGLVSIASIPTVIDKLEKRVLEIMTLALPEKEIASVLTSFMSSRKVSVLAIGPGMEPKFALAIATITQDVDLPLIIDGGGLGALQNHPKLLERRTKAPRILTPHLGEFQRFFNEPLTKESNQLLFLAANFAKTNQVILVLKGHPTYVFNIDGTSNRIDSGTPALATAGTGDVLTGLIGGIIAQGIEPLPAVITAVYLHGKAGDLAAQSKTTPGVIASDVIEEITAALEDSIQ
jgi:NAD(P)H-hydrate epimerase